MASRMKSSLLLLGMMAALGLFGCGHSEIGEECETAGATDECVDSAVCTNGSTGVPVCRKICTEQEDCATTENCNGISGTNMKSCQPSIVAP